MHHVGDRCCRAFFLPSPLSPSPPFSPPPLTVTPPSHLSRIPHHHPPLPPSPCNTRFSPLTHRSSIGVFAGHRAGPRCIFRYSRGHRSCPLCWMREKGRKGGGSGVDYILTYGRGAREICLSEVGGLGYIEHHTYLLDMEMKSKNRISNRLPKKPIHPPSP